MKSKALITGVNEDDEMGGPPQRPPGPGGGPRPPRPGPDRGRHRTFSGQPGHPDAGEGGEVGLSPREKAAFKDIILLDLAAAFAGGDPFYTELVQCAVEGREPDKNQIRHLMDEAGKFAKQLGPEHNELMNKLAAKT